MKCEKVFFFFVNRDQGPPLPPPPLLHIDLPVSVDKESNPNIYSYTYAKTERITPPTWLLVTATVGVLLIILLVIVIIIIILRIRRLSKEERNPAEVHHMQDKNMDHGTDV